jgi:hypothetical protein
VQLGARRASWPVPSQALGHWAQISTDKKGCFLYYSFFLFLFNVFLYFICVEQLDVGNQPGNVVWAVKVIKLRMSQFKNRHFGFQKLITRNEASLSFHASYQKIIRKNKIGN